MVKYLLLFFFVLEYWQQIPDKIPQIAKTLCQGCYVFTLVCLIVDWFVRQLDFTKITECISTELGHKTGPGSIYFWCGSDFFSTLSLFSHGIMHES